LNDKKKKSYLQHGEILYGHKYGDSLATIAKNIKCSKTTMHDILKRYAQTESTMPRKCSGPKVIFNKSALEELRKIVTQDTKHHQLSLKEIQDLWKKEKNQKVSISIIRHALKKYLSTSIKDLEIKVKAAWYSISSKCYRKLSNSMIRRVKACYGAD
ncbi:7452_t:CDS:2, partial [Cetraspora pellucida]